ncbi:MAG: hypothetical protein K6343_02985 [Caldisericaceae bacterium]
MNKEDKLNDVIENFLDEKEIDFTNVSDELKEMFEIAILLKKDKVNPKISKEKVFSNTLNTYREEVCISKKKDEINFLGLLLNFLFLIFDYSPYNFETHSEPNISVHAYNDFRNIKSSLYLQSHQFLYNYIGNFVLPMMQTLR